MNSYNQNEINYFKKTVPVVLLSSLLKKIYYVLENHSLGNAANHQGNVPTSWRAQVGSG